MAREVNFDIVAKDKASDTLDAVAKDAAKVEKLDPTVTVDADTKAVDRSIDDVVDQLDGLTDADKIVVLALRAGNTQSELSALTTELAGLDGTEADVGVKIERYNELTGELDKIESKIKDIADESLDPDVGDKARQRLEGIGEEAGKTQGAVHSMAGNALGDFAATTSGIGPLGEAIGQLTETALEGEAGMKGLATAGLGLGALSAGMFVVNKVMGEFAKTAQRAAEIKAFNTQDVDAFTKALTTGKDAAQDYVDRMTELGKVTTVAATRISDFAGPVLESTKDIAPALGEAGITMEQFAKAVTGSKDDLERFNTAVRQTGVSTDTANLIISGAATEAENYAKAQDNAARFTKVFGDNVDHTGEQVKALSDLTQDMRNKLVGADKAAAGLGDRLGDAAAGTKKLADQYAKLSDQISSDQAMLDLADQIDAVTDAGNAAITAQKEADEARRTGAKDATDQQREAEAAMRDYQTAINQTKQDIINLAASAGASPVELKTALDKVDQGDLNGAKADAEAWSKRNPIELTVKLSDIGAAIKKAAAAAGTTAVTVPTSTTTINQFLAAPVAARELARTSGRRARINGR
jgi:hypothetical protein